jgi:outer membrane lipase/esterase
VHSGFKSDMHHASNPKCPSYLVWRFRFLRQQLAGDLGVSIFDIYGLGTTIAANPGMFGLVNVTDACGAPSNACDPATAEYWDGIHPTAAAHMLIADAFLAEAVPEPST